MQPARIKLHAKEHTNNPVQRPNFRGQGAKKLRDRVRHSSGSKNGSSRNDTTPKSFSCQGQVGLRTFLPSSTSSRTIHDP